MLLAAMLLLAILLPRLADKPCAGFNAALPVPLLPMPALGRRCSHRQKLGGMPSSCTLASTKFDMPSPSNHAKAASSLWRRGDPRTQVR